MKKVILCPNPYRDSELRVCKEAKKLLDALHFQTVVCLPFQREGYGAELGLRITRCIRRSARRICSSPSAATAPFCIWPGRWRCTASRCWE